MHTHPEDHVTFYFTSRITLNKQCVILSKKLLTTSCVIEMYFTSKLRKMRMYHLTVYKGNLTVPKTKVKKLVDKFEI